MYNLCCQPCVSSIIKGSALCYSALFSCLQIILNNINVLLWEVLLLWSFLICTFVLPNKKWYLWKFKCECLNKFSNHLSFNEHCVVLITNECVFIIWWRLLIFIIITFYFKTNVNKLSYKYIWLFLIREVYLYSKSSLGNGVHYNLY